MVLPFIWYLPPAPTPSPTESEGTYRLLVPRHLNPLSWGKYIPLILSRPLITIGNYKNNNKKPLLQGFLGKLENTIRPQGPKTVKIPLSEKNVNVHAAPLCIRAGGISKPWTFWMEIIV